MTADERPYIADQAPAVLLRAVICEGPERQYAVAIIAENGSPAAERDLLRFALYYYAYALHELARNGHSALDLAAAVDKYATASSDGRTDAFSLGGMPGRLAATVGAPLAEALVLFRRTSSREFDIACDIPLQGAALASSVLAVVQAVVQRVSPDVADEMRAGLANMNASYVVMHQFSDPASCQAVPAIAYRAAAFIWPETARWIP